MDPISIAIEIELGTILIAGVTAVYAWFHHKHKKREMKQRNTHHKQLLTMRERHFLLAKEGEGSEEQHLELEGIAEEPI